MTRPLPRPGRPAALVAAVAAVASGAHGAEATGSVTIEPPVGAQVIQNLRMQTRIMLGNGNVASLSIPGTVNATGSNGGNVQLPTTLAPGGALTVPPDTSVSVNTSGALPGGGPYAGVMLVLVQFN